MTKDEYIAKWRGIYAKKNKRIQILSERLCDSSMLYDRQSIANELNRVEAEATTINVMLLELETEVE